VYRFAVAAAPTWHDRLCWELLSTGGTAAGLSAVALYGLTESAGRPHVLVPRGSRHAVPGRHTTRELPPEECTTVDGLRALVPVRAVLDAAHRMPYGRAVDMIETAIVRGIVKPVALERRARELRHGKRPGCAVTLAVLENLHHDLARARNEWEAFVLRRAAELGLPQPAIEFEIVVAGRRYILDAAWPERLVTLEFDGRDPHMRKEVHDSDSLRRNDLMAAGWLRFGVTAAALRRGDDRVFLQVAEALHARAAVSVLGTASVADARSMQYQAG
jgi:hypothetical protein